MRRNVIKQTFAAIRRDYASRATLRQTLSCEASAMHKSNGFNC